MAKAKAKTKTKAKKAAPERVKLFKHLGKGKGQQSVQYVLDRKSVITTISEPFSTGKDKKVTLANPEKAKAKYDQLVAAKRAEGYRELGEMDPPKVAIARNEELEAALRENRDDAGPYLVYADWLQGQGSPVGEMLVFAQRKKQKEALAIANKIGLPGPDVATFGWKLGLWQWLRLDNGVDWSDATWDPIPFVRNLFSSPLCMALEELKIAMLRWDFTDQPAVIKEAANHGWAKDLQRLTVGDVDRGIDMDHHQIGDVAKVISKSFPNLTYLKLHSGSQEWRGKGESFGVAGLDLPKLKELVVETCAMTGKRAKAIATANFPALERLELWFGARDRSATARIADVFPIFDSKRFPKLKHLGLRNSELVTDIVRLLPGSTLARQLESLDLSMSIMSDADAAELAAEAAKFPALKTLDVGDSYVYAEGFSALKKAFKGVKVLNKDPKEDYDDGDDNEDGEPTRYVSVHE